MKKINLIILCLILLCSTSIYSQVQRGTDITPKKIKAKYYVWSKKTKESNPGSNPKNIWFNSYSNKMDGYVILLTGEKLRGEIIVRRRWNLASTKKISENYTTSSGEKAIRKIKNPAGVDLILEVNITNEKGSKKISTEEIKNYGPYFTTKDWVLVKSQKNNPEKMLTGSIEDFNGNKKEGLLTLNTHSYLKRKFDLRYYNVVFFTEKEGGKCELIYSKNLKQVIQFSTIYTNYRTNYLIDRDLLIATLKSNAKKLSYLELIPGSIMTTDGELIKGLIAERKNKTISSKGNTTTVMGEKVIKVPDLKHIIFINDSKNIKYISVNNASIIYYSIEGMDYYSVDGNFVNRDNLSLEQGKLVYSDGIEKEGELTYRNNYFLYDDGSGKLSSITVKNSKNLSYVVLGKDDSLRKVVLAEGIVKGKQKKYFIEIRSPFGKYSYYKNPHPTNVRNGGSLAASLGAVAGGSLIEHRLDKEGVEYEKEVEGGNDEISLYFKEWIVLINKTGEKIMVYKKNLEDQKRLLLGSCQRMSVENRKTIKNVDKLKDIHTLVNALNQCADED